MTAVATESPRPVVLIDLSAIFRAAWHANPDGPTTVAFEATIGGVSRCANNLPNALVAVCCDGRGNWRKALSADYKAHREKQPEAMYGMLDRVKARLVADARLLWEAEGFEADDLIATAASKARAAGHEVRICTNDKDMSQLLGVGVDVLSTRTWEVATAETVSTKLGIEISQLGDYLALCGDASDGVKGAPGIGPKRAAELLKKYGTLDKLLDAAQIPEKDEFTPAILKSLTEYVEQVKLARKLVSLRSDAPIDFEKIYERREVQRLTEVSMDDELTPERDDKTVDMFADTEKAKTEDPKSATGATAASEPHSAEPATRAVEAASNGESTALVPAEYAKALEPRSFKEAMICARYLYESRLFGQFANPEAIAAIVMRGRELGLGAGTALTVFHVVEGRPYPYAYLIIARAKAHPDCEYFQCVDASDKSATWETKNRNNPKPTRVTFTMEQAKTAGLVRDKNGWAKNPEDMLVKTAGAKLARREYPDSALGLFAIEEVGSDRD